jgi:hypothetical protein
MMDFGSGPQTIQPVETFESQVNRLVDAAYEAEMRKQKPRNYIGGSRLGHYCDRALGYEYQHFPKDPGRDFSARAYRIFRDGHRIEDQAIEDLRRAGFVIKNARKDGGQFGFSILDGKVKGHIDGAVIAAPLPMVLPAIWECKSMNDKKWTKCQREGVLKSHPVYYYQMQTYMTYMQLWTAPALFTAYNKNTSEYLHQLVPYNPAAAQEASDRGFRVVSAPSPEYLARISNDPSNFQCKWCDYRERCHAEALGLVIPTQTHIQQPWNS